MLLLLEEAKKDKKKLKSLKEVAVRCQMFELGSKLRDLEVDLFPETEEEKEAKLQSEKYNLIFRMVDLNVSHSICWLISETIKKSNKKKGNFSISDAEDLLAKKRRIFNED